MRLLEKLRAALRTAPAKRLDGEDIERLFTRKRVLWSMAAILAAATALRLVNIQAETYWADEILSLDITTAFDSVREMVRYVYQVEFHPPLYYLMLRGWVGLFGASEAATRSLSLLFGLAQIALTYFFARDLTGRRSVGVAAAFLLAIAPFSVEFGQEARPYTMVLLAGTLSAWSLWRFLRGEDRGWRWLALYFAGTLFGLYLSYSYLLLASVTAGWWIIEMLLADRRSRRRCFFGFIAVHGAVFLAYYPWLDAFLGKMMLSDHYIFSLSRRNLPFRDAGFASAIVDRMIWSTKLETYPLYFLALQLVAKASLAVAVLAWAVRRRDIWQRRESYWPYLYAFWLAVALLVAFVVSPMSTPYSAFFMRHVIFLLVPISVLVSVVLLDLGRPGLLLGLFLLSTLVVPLGNVLTNDSLWDFDHRFGIIGEHIRENAKPGDIVVVYISTLRTDISHYLPDDIPVLSVEPLNYYGLDVWQSRRTLGLVENELQVRVGGQSDQGEGAKDGSVVTEEAIVRKLNLINRDYHPKRIWFVGLRGLGSDVRSYYKERGWRWSFKSLGVMFPVDLYENPDYAVQK